MNRSLWGAGGSARADRRVLSSGDVADDPLSTAFRERAFKSDPSDSVISVIHVDDTPSQRVAMRRGMQRERRTDMSGYGLVEGVPHYVYRVRKTE